MNMTLLAQTLVDGLILGGIYSLSAVGFSLIFGVLGVVNLAHGVIVLLGAYAALVMQQHFGLDPLLSIPFVFALLFVLGALLQLTIVGPAIRRGSLISTMLVTFGAALILKDLIVLTIGPDIQTLSSNLTLGTSTVADVIVDGARSTALLASLGLLGLLTVILKWTKAGQAIRATAQQGFAAALCGIDGVSIYAVTFGVSAGFAGASGVIVGIINPFVPSSDAFWTLNAFVTVVLGGVGSPVGALVGGLLLGLISTLSSQYVGATFPNIFMVCTLLLMLLIRPNGIMGNAYKGSV